MQGLGKTIQVIALLAHLSEEYGNVGPHMLVVPCAVRDTSSCELLIQTVNYQMTQLGGASLLFHITLIILIQQETKCTIK